MQNKVIHNSVSNKKGNIWLFWSKTLPEPTVVSMSSQMITVSVGGFLVSGVHAHVGVVQRRFLWTKMELISDLKQPWMTIGDFNSITSSEEKIGGRTVNRKSMQEFNTCLANCELIQAPKNGLQHSWSNCQHGNRRILCNLDRVVYNQLWFQKNEDWSYKVGLRIASDHSPLLGGNVAVPKPKNVLWKFQKMWSSHPGFMEVVLQCWSEEKLKEAEEEVKEAMIDSDLNPFDTAALDRLVTAENNLNSKEVHLSTMLKQKARVKWVNEWSANTSFFYTNFKIRQSRNFISELQDHNGDITTDQAKIADTLIQHFQKKFQFQDVVNDDTLLEAIQKVINEEDQQMLDAIPDEEEIKSTIFHMDPDSSPGPDGFSGWLYKSCWDIIKHDVIQAVQLCWKRRFIPKGLNSNFLVLLPKIDGAKTPNHFRPIGLRNVSYKIFTKIINTILSSLMNKLITPQQVAYIKGRSIQE
ncbi:uncharacterized protein LOC113316214 [Papaver somniferum]|uniref:uncharacterized protein LOC113316214 n=1 Tax=Papaver somniferum TaxID=3469 RepID=UPI000E703938|nr:uncharacterized protein LOC113316214 [Papaver somniferum]